MDPSAIDTSIASPGPDTGRAAVRPSRAVALVSGGLDSMLAARLMIDQGVEVEGLNFFTGFCVDGHTHAIRHRDGAPASRNSALHVAERLGIPLHFLDVVEAYKQVVLVPRHGHGAHLNPCIDCKSFMVARALEWMRTRDFDFIVTGEVVGQRPKSQRRETMPLMRTQEAAQALAPGSVLEVACTDPDARDDIPAWCRINGHEVLGTAADGAGFEVTVRIGAPR